MTPVFPSIQANFAYSVTPSDAADVSADTANPDDATAIFLHNPTSAAIDVRVMPAGQSSAAANVAAAVTILIPSGGTFPLAVRKVYATSPTVNAGELIGMYSKQR
jgi:hypothetical protein